MQIEVQRRLNEQLEVC